MSDLAEKAIATNVHAEETRVNSENVPRPDGEPQLAQLDNNILNLILETATQVIRDENGSIMVDSSGQPMRQVIYPDVLSWTIALSHLDRTSNLDRDDAFSVMAIHQNNLLRCRARYRNNPEVLDLLNKVEASLNVLLKGDAKEGRRQRYLSTTYRSYKIEGSPQQEKRHWWER